MKKHKILIVISNLNIGGTERHLMQILPRINRKKFDVSVYVTHEKGSFGSCLEEQGIRIYSSWLVRVLHRFGSVGRILAYIASGIRLFGLMLYLRPKIVHSYLQGPYLLGTFCGLLARRPYILMSRRIVYNDNSNRFLYRIEKVLHRYLTLATACSDEIAVQMQEEGVPKEKLVTLYNGVDLTRFSMLPSCKTARKDLNISDTDFIILIIANLHPRKAHTDLLEALSLIKEKLPKNWRLISLGRDIGELDSLRRQAKLLCIEQYIQWVGETKNVLPYLCSADMGVLCSYREGFSNSLLECMAVGLPVVVTDISGSNEAIKQGHSGLIVPTHAPKKLAEAILKIASDFEFRKQLGINVKKRVHSHFSLDVCVSNYEALYNKLLA